ncbi:MAG: hypothetical protein CMG85_11905 [Marinobacter sp.]|jgi:hypothetical protein|nr:hypothetical protein [Marinobacter sp.]|tara:strand:+ start:915 stop:1142 length:228 start_codon:yes stop_codon:yes gene_type:complete
MDETVPILIIASSLSAIKVNQGEAMAHTSFTPMHQTTSRGVALGYQSLMSIALLEESVATRRQMSKLQLRINGYK